MAVVEDLAASVELSYLFESLRPPCQVGDFWLTALLAQTRTSLVFSARDTRQDLVLKLTGTMHAHLLAHELAVQRECADADVPGVIRPLCDELIWLSAPGGRLAAAVALPHLSGGDLASFADRAARSGQLGVALSLAAALPIANALRGLLCDLSRPLVHGDLQANNVLLPSATAGVEGLELIDLDQAHSPEGDESEVAAFGSLLRLLAGERSGNKRFDRLVERCLRGSYASMADASLWRDLNGVSRRG